MMDSSTLRDTMQCDTPSCKRVKTDSSLVTPAAHDKNGSPLSQNEIRSLLLKEAKNYDIHQNGGTKKRDKYLPWDDFFMGIAFLSAQRSKDPTTPTGACIVDRENRIVGIGYNGLPRGCSDDVLPWNSCGEKWLHTRDPYVCHAEVNAILNKCSADVVGARLYVAHFPCNDCAKIIIQSNISEIIYMHNVHCDTDESRASRILFALAGVKTRQYQPTVPSISLNFVASMAPNIEDVPCEEKKSSNENDDKQQFRKLMMEEADLDPTCIKSTKRQDYLSWDDYFMACAFLTAMRSKDPNTQVGACIVDTQKRIIGVGYNGFPRGCSDNYLPWSRDAETELHKKYLYVCHAEVNAILNKCSADVSGATLYVALFPCHNCAKMIIQAGIKEVVFLSDYYHDTDQCRASRIMFQMAGVTLRRHVPSKQIVNVEFE